MTDIFIIKNEHAIIVFNKKINRTSLGRTFFKQKRVPRFFDLPCNLPYLFLSFLEYFCKIKSKKIFNYTKNFKIICTFT